MSKPRLSYKEFCEQQMKWSKGTMAWFIEERIRESRKPGARPLGDSHYYTLRRLQEEAIGKVDAASLKPTDLLDHGRARKAKGIQAPTINQDITFLRGVVRDAVELEQLPQESLLAFMKAKRRLEKEQLIGKSRARTRRPTDDELSRLLEHFTKQNEHPAPRPTW
jgi:hypothetical protein